MNIEAGEGKGVALVLIQSFFLGIFSATFDVAAHALFLQEFDSAQLANAYMYSGFAGILMAALYSWLQKTIPFSRLIALNFLAIGLITLGLWFGFQNTESKWLIFFSFVMMGPLNIIALVGFNGMVIRMFTLRQGKRLFGLVDSGIVFGIIVMGFLISLILKVLKTNDLLLLSSVSMFVAVLVQFAISRSFDLGAQDANTSDDSDEKPKGSYSVLFKDPYVRMLAAFTVITMVGLFFIMFSFLAVTKSKYPTEEELAGFLGSFTSSLMIFSLLIKTFVYSKLVKTYGLKIGLLILPLLMIFFTGLAILAGHVFEYENISFDFVFFFLLISMSRLFSVSLKESIQTPSFKLLYQSLDKSIRFDVQAKVDGVVNELAATLSGIILVILSSLSFLKLIHFSYFTLAISAIWAYLAVKLYNEYKASLQNSLTKIKSSDISEITGVNEEKEESKVGLTLRKYFDPVGFKALAGIAPKPDAVKLQFEDLRNMAYARNREERMKVFDYMLNASFTHEENAQLLGNLIRDVEPEVRYRAIEVIYKLKVEELYHYLIDFLSFDTYKNSASFALVEIGDSLLASLDQAFYKTGMTLATQMEILNIYRKIDSPKTIAYLEKKITYPDYFVAIESMKILNEKEYKASEDIRPKIKHHIELSIRNSTWLLAIQNTLNANEEVSAELKDAVNTEVRNSLDMLYLFLSLIYEKQTITFIKQNIESGSTESNGFAIELLELFVDEDLKPTLFPLLEDLPIAEKISQLEQFFPIEIGDVEFILRSLINKDYNYISRWTKACAIYDLLKFNTKEKDFLIANLFNPDNLLKETAAYVFQQLDAEQFEMISKRLSIGDTNKLEVILDKASKNREYLLFEKSRFLKTVPEFKNASAALISKISSHLSIKDLPANTAIQVKGDSTCFPLVFVIQGTVAKESQGKEVDFFESGSVLSDLLLDATDASFKTKTPCRIYTLEHKHYFSTLNSFPELSECLSKLSFNHSNVIA